MRQIAKMRNSRKASFYIANNGKIYICKMEQNQLKLLNIFSLPFCLLFILRRRLIGGAKIVWQYFKGIVK